MLKAIDAKSIHKICSGQVITDLPNAVKELIENAIDAKATKITIELVDNGLSSITLIDNGTGIPRSEFSKITMKYYTSKIEKFEDIKQLTTLGFRGEALSSLCLLCSSFSLCTREGVIDAFEEEEVFDCYNSDDELDSTKLGTLLTFSKDGRIMSETQKPHHRGTTVYLKEIFAGMPVRREELLRNAGRSYQKLLTLIQQYALSYHYIKFHVSNYTSSKKGNMGNSIVLNTNGGGKLVEPIVSIFGFKLAQKLSEINLSTFNPFPFSVSGMVSKGMRTCGRSASDRQFFTINKRPVDLPKIGKLFNDLYRQINPNQYPILFLHFTFPPEIYDVNVTPDKRTIFLNEEAEFIAEVKTLFSSHVWSLESHAVLGTPSKIRRSGSSSSLSHDEDDDFKESQFSELSPKSLSLTLEKDESFNGNNGGGGNTPLKRSFSSFLSNTLPVLPKANKKVKVTSSQTLTDQQRDYSSPLFSLSPLHSSPREGIKRNDIVQRMTLHKLLDKSPSSTRGFSRLATHSNIRSSSGDKNRNGDTFASKVIFSTGGFGDDDLEFNEVESERMGDDDNDADLDNNDNYDNEKNENGENSAVFYDHKLAEYEVDDGDKKMIVITDDNEEIINMLFPNTNSNLRSSSQSLQHKEDLQIACSIQSISSQIAHRSNSSFFNYLNTSINNNNNVNNDNINCKLNSGQIAEMRGKDECCGIDITDTMNDLTEDTLLRVFNKSDFAKLKIVGQFNLGFIIAELNSDIFIIDQHAADEKYNYERFMRNSAQYIKTQSLICPQSLELTAGEEDLLLSNLNLFKQNGFSFHYTAGSMAGRRLQMIAKPSSKSVDFGLEDIYEMLYQLQEGKDFIQPSRISKMFASKACRSSIMIGTALSFSQMKQIVNNLSTMDNPWCCPHGRPTMRFLHHINTKN